MDEALVEKNLLSPLKIPLNTACKTQAGTDLCGGRGERDTPGSSPCPAPPQLEVGQEQLKTHG